MWQFPGTFDPRLPRRTGRPRTERLALHAEPDRFQVTNPFKPACRLLPICAQASYNQPMGVVPQTLDLSAPNAAAGPGQVSDATVGTPSSGNPSQARQEPEAPTDQRSHDDLLDAIASTRDKTAFAELFSHFAPRLKSYLIRLGTDAAMSEEVAQEAMVMVWRKAESFDRKQASAATWIFTIARNKRIDRLRRERRPELDPNDPALVPDAPDAADRSIEVQQTEESLRSAIEKLPQEQSELIRAAYFEDKTHREIADQRGIPLGTVKSRIRLALARLRQEIDGFDTDPRPSSG